jgi:hypothetical protein
MKSRAGAQLPSMFIQRAAKGDQDRSAQCGRNRPAKRFGALSFITASRSIIARQTLPQEETGRHA